MESYLFSFEGRIRRSTYWTRAIVALAIQGFAIFMIKLDTDSSLKILCLFIIIVSQVFGIIQIVKRMHDVGKRGWYILIPIYGLILAFTDGTTGINEYGKNPKEKNPKEDEFFNGLMTLLVSALVSCAIYALLSLTNIITSETIKNGIFILSFTVCNFYLLSWHIIDSERKNLIKN